MKSENKLNEAKIALDAIIKKSRVHLYKPIQIAEILFRDRTIGDIDLSDLETYRNKSKKWRDDVSLQLLGRVYTSSARFQDDLFNENAMPPQLLSELGKENRKNSGCVEAYIYNRFTNRHSQLSKALQICTKATTKTFDLKQFINAFWSEPGLKRSIDKVYEIIVYSLFSTLVETLEMKIEISLNNAFADVLSDFEDFAKTVMCLDLNTTTIKHDAKIFRVGVTNAADRGLDMYFNWGPAIQIKHLTLDVELAKSIVEGISSDRIVIVCKDVEKDVIVSLLTQIGWKSRIQSVVTEQNLIDWYEKALRGSHSNLLGERLLQTMHNELENEFPSIGIFPPIIADRKYESVTLPKMWNTLVANHKA